jgi:hypothetical protein
MNNLLLALQAFWGGFVNGQTGEPIPAYLETFELRDLPFPRITFEVVRSPALERTIISASVWNRSPRIGFIGLTNDVVEQIGSKIPHGGVKLNVLNNNSVWLYRSNPFIQYLSEPNDTLVTRAVVRVEIINYMP